MKRVLFVSSILLFSACKEPLPPSNQTPCELSLEMVSSKGFSIASDDSTLNNEEPSRDCVLPTPEPGANLVFHVTLTDFNEEKEGKMRDALLRAKIVLNSTDFKNRILNHSYNGEKTFVDNKGMSNEEIYKTIMDGKEDLLPEIDNEMDLDMTLYYKNNSTVGYTYPDTIRIWVNDKFFAGYNPGQVANNAVHEWSHKLGFGHDYYNTPERAYSVPYAVGKIIEELVNSL